MVGGFSQSDYLISRVKEACSTSIVIVRPENSWTGVVRGAAMMDMNQVTQASSGVSVVSRVSRADYGAYFFVADDGSHPRDKV